MSQNSKDFNIPFFKGLIQINYTLHLYARFLRKLCMAKMLCGSLSHFCLIKPPGEWDQTQWDNFWDGDDGERDPSQACSVWE